MMKQMTYGMVFILVCWTAGCQSSSRRAVGERDASKVQRVAFRVDAHTQAIPPDKLSHAWTITSVGYEPIVVKGVAFNGEVPARLATFDGTAYVPSAQAFPVKVATEQSFTLFQDNPKLGDYSKEVRYFIIETDHGTYRHDWISGKTVRLNKVMQ